MTSTRLKTITVRAHKAEKRYITLGQALTMRLAQLPQGSTVVATVPTMTTLFGDSPRRYEVVEADVIVRIPCEPRPNEVLQLAKRTLADL